MQFQNTILICHIAIFLEFGVVHYAARQVARQRAKHKDDADFFQTAGEYFRDSEYTGSEAQSGHSGGYSGVGEHQTRSIDGGAERRSLRAAPGSASVSSDAQGFSIQEDAAIGMPSVANMLTETLDHIDNDSSCLDRCSRCRRTTRPEQEELSEFRSSLAEKGAARARTWHQFGGTYTNA